MADQTYLVKLKPPGRGVQHVIAAIVEIHGDHLAFLDAKRKLAALFLLEIVESWNEMQGK
jgi:hypothetical protein